MMWVYGFQCHDFIKIGVAGNMALRRKQLQAGNPYPLKRIIMCRCPEGAYYLERRIHEILAEHAIGREWFSVTPEQARAAVERAKSDLGGAHTVLGGWRLARAEQIELLKAARETRRLARGQIERDALLGNQTGT